MGGHARRACLPIAFLAYALAVSALAAWAPSLPFGAFAVLITLVVSPRLFPHVDDAVSSGARGPDMHWRMAAGAFLVLGVTHFSASLGPRLSGVLAMFPVMASVLAAFSHRHSGRAFAIGLLRGTVSGYYSFAVFCGALALLLPSIGVAAAFGLSLGAAVVVQGASRVLPLRGQASGVR